eukprot:4467499-Alexandrium_andersonii.AAC.1
MSKAPIETSRVKSSTVVYTTGCAKTNASTSRGHRPHARRKEGAARLQAGGFLSEGRSASGSGRRSPPSSPSARVRRLSLIHI